MQVCLDVSLLLFSHSVVSDSLWPHGRQHARLLCPHHLPGFAQVHVHCIGDSIQPSHPLMPSSPSALSVSLDHKNLQYENLVFLITGKISDLPRIELRNQWGSSWPLLCLQNWGNRLENLQAVYVNWVACAAEYTVSSEKWIDNQAPKL